MYNEYGFHGSLTEDYPSQLVVDVTDVCNLRCAHCQQAAMTSRPNYKKQHLDVALHKKLIDDICQNSQGHCKYVRYTAAGEPLLHPHLFELLAYAKAHSGTTISLTTNGTLLSAEAIQQVLKYVDIIDISLDAYSSEVYSQVRRGGNREKVYTQVAALIAKKKALHSSLRIVTTFIEQPVNAHEVTTFKQYWEDAGADYVIVRRLHSCAGSDLEVAEQLRGQYLETERYPCIYPWERLVLTPHGKLAFCPTDWTHGAGIADFDNTSIAEAWQGEAMQSLRNAHLTNNFACYPLCAQCPDWSTTRWPHMGRRFADMVQEFEK